MKAINFGCGAAPTIGYINIDNSISIFLAKSRLLSFVLFKAKIINIETYNFIKKIQKSKIKIYRSIKNCNLDNNSVDIIYSSMTLHHMSKDNFIHQCESFYKLLKSESTLRIVLPDIDNIIDDYVATKNSNILCNLLCNFQDIEKNFFPKIKVLKLLITGYRGRAHLYNFDDIHRSLLDVGFSSVIRVEPGETSIRESVGELNLHERALEIPMYIEARK